MTLRIATAASFRHDRVIAHLRLLETAEVDCILLTYLDEEVLSRLAVERETDSAAGHVPEVAVAVRAVAPRLFLEPGLRVITDAGGLNPVASAEAIARALTDAGSSELPLAVVRGDDLRESLEEIHASGCPLEHRETGAPYTDLQRPILAAHAELGANGVRQALAEGARVIVTGATAPSSFAVAVAVHEFRWDWEDWDKLAGAAVAGTLLSIGDLLTCGDAHEDVLHAIDLAPPIAELCLEGKVALSKVPGADGRVTCYAIAASIADEAADGTCLLTPDVEIDLTSAQLAERPDRQDVLLWGATGRPAPASYHVTLCHHDGYTSIANLWIADRGAAWPAERLTEFLGERVRRGGHSLESINAFELGRSDDNAAKQASAGLVQLTATSCHRAAVEQFADEVAALSRSVPFELIPLGDPRPPVGPLVRQWPTLVPRELVQPTVEVRPASDWL